MCCTEAEGAEADAGKMKTKVRRLYDIANILQSLHLLEKTQLADSRKPAFRWLGIEKRIAKTPSHTLKQFYRYPSHCSQMLQPALGQCADVSFTKRGCSIEHAAYWAPNVCM